MSSLSHILAIVVGFLGGLTAFYFLENQLTPQNVSFVLGGLSIGSVVEILTILHEYFRTPRLDYSGVFVSKTGVYFLRVRKTKGEGKAEECEGYLALAGTEIVHTPTVWEHPNAPRVVDIGDFNDLRLFMVEGEHIKLIDMGEGALVKKMAEIKVKKSIVFPSANPVEGFAENRYDYDENVEKQLTITVVANKGRLPDPYKKNQYVR